jgi:hypothetical protein
VKNGGTKEKGKLQQPENMAAYGELALVQEDRECDQSNGDDPENDVLGTLFLVCHSGSTTYLAIRFKCCCEFWAKKDIYGFDAVLVVAVRL